MTRKKTTDLIKKSIKELQKKKKLSQFIIPEVLVERPEEKLYGDYSTNITMQIAKVAKKNPMEIANNLGSRLQVLGSRFFERVEVAKPGFVNFFLSKGYLQKQVAEILKKGEKFGQIDIGRGEGVNIEFISANPTGPLHIGNGRNAFAGDVLANVLKMAGYKVAREYYINDAKNSKQIIELGKTVLGQGEMYKTSYLLNLVKNIKVLKSKAPAEVGFLVAKKIQKDVQDFLVRKLKVRFDRWISEERDIYQKSKVKKVLNLLRKRNLIYKKDESWWSKTSKFGDERDWVVIRKTGEPTYLLSDIAYHKDKFDRRFSKIINIWGADHQAHVSKIKAAAKMLGFKGQLDILILQLVSLKGGGKISKRKGGIVTLEDLVGAIGLDVARWFYLQKSLDTHMEIDWALAKEQSEKNPVYYVQYAHARIHSILAKSKIKNQKSKIQLKSQNLKLLTHSSELELIKQLIRLPEVIEDIAKDYQVQRLPQYAVDLATSFHQFYRDCRVLTEDQKLTQARVDLLLATKSVLKSSLKLMGIRAPERM